MREQGSAVAVFAILATIVLIFLPLPLGRVLEDGTREFALPILRFFSWVSSQMETDSSAEIRRLKLEIQKLKMENAMLTGLQDENDRLRKVLRFAEEKKFSFIPARVISRATPTWWEMITIDKGTADGVREGMAVVSMEGLVGVIRSTTQGSAQVLLLGDEQVRIAATVEGSDNQGIIVGAPNPEGVPVMRLTFLSKQNESLEGRRVITSGMGGVLPVGLIIGVITASADTREAGGFGLFEEYYVKPIADLANLKDLFVVVGKGQVN